MYVKMKGANNFENVCKSVLLDFLKKNTDDKGALQEVLEVRTVVPFVKKGNNDEMSWIFSDFSVDREFERISQNGWDLSNYEKNPVVLWAHNHSIPSIGYAKNLTIKDSLCGDVVFNDKSFDEFGWSIGERVKFGSIKSGSVGFLVKEIEIVDHKKNPDEKADIIYRKQELLEFSICNVPCNANALHTDSVKSFTEYNFYKNLINNKG